MIALGNNGGGTGLSVVGGNPVRSRMHEGWR